MKTGGAHNPHHHHEGMGCRSPWSKTSQNHTAALLRQLGVSSSTWKNVLLGPQCFMTYGTTEIIWLGKFSKQVLLVIHPNHRKASKNTLKLHLTQSMGIPLLPRGLTGVSHKTHSQLTAWNYVTGSLSFGACQPKKQSFSSSLGKTELFFLALVRY